MSNITIGRVQTTGIETQHQQLTPQQVQQRIALFTNDQVDKSKTSSPSVAPSGQTLPAGVDPNSKASFDEAFASASPEAQAQLLEAGNQLSKGLGAAVASGQGANDPGLQRDLTTAVGAAQAALGTGNSNEAVAAAAFASIDATNADMAELAQKVQGNLAQKEEIRNEMKEVREEIAEIDDHIDDIEDMLEGPGPYTGVDSEGNTVTLSKEEWQKEIEDLKGEKEGLETKLENLDSDLQTITDMNQMDNLMLQDMMQKSQQMFQLLSNMSKSMHDTAKALIQNAKA